MKKNKKAFTLLEIIVTLVIIGILVVWATNIDFSSQIEKQKAIDIENNIFYLINTTKKNSLLWKWIWKEALFIDEYIIKINSGSIISWYNSWSYTELEKINNDKLKIQNIKSYNYDKTQSWTHSDIEIIIKWPNLSLSWSTWSILTFESNYWSWAFITEFYLNTITWMFKRWK